MWKKVSSYSCPACVLPTYITSNGESKLISQLTKNSDKLPPNQELSQKTWQLANLPTNASPSLHICHISSIVPQPDTRFPCSCTGDMAFTAMFQDGVFVDILDIFRIHQIDVSLESWLTVNSYETYIPSVGQQETDGIETVSRVQMNCF